VAINRENNTPEVNEAGLRIYGTNPVEPEEGRIFVWTQSGWFERIEGTSGNVAFTPVADSEEELRELIARDDPALDLIMLGREFGQIVAEEFNEQSPDYRDTPVYSEEEDVDEDEDQEFHQHDL